VTWLGGAAIQGVTVGLATSAWSMNGSLPPWESGKEYYVRTRAVDRAHNVSAVIYSTFTFDNSAPSANITSPADSSVGDATVPRPSSIALISGTAQDSAVGPFPAGVSQVELRIRDLEIGKYWDFSTGDTSPAGFSFASGDNAWFVAVTTTTPAWQVWTSTFSWRTGVRYSVEARAKDAAGNYSATYSTADFRFDSTPPTSGVAQPADQSTVRTLTTITGTASDPASGTVSLVQLAVRKNSTMKWWNAASVNPD
jgi:hypothetical protein